MRLAVLGMGRGHALAERLLGGDHEVTVWNRTPYKADDLVAKGARASRSIRHMRARKFLVGPPSDGAGKRRRRPR
jgi:3-hydroxyisobutyrate dehydrogenase-like beta-hydroxyacid dehydrogenase